MKIIKICVLLFLLSFFASCTNDDKPEAVATDDYKIDETAFLARINTSILGKKKDTLVGNLHSINFRKTVR